MAAGHPLALCSTLIRAATRAKSHATIFRADAAFARTAKSMTVRFGFGENWLKFAADLGSVHLALLPIPIIVFVLGIVQLHYLQPFYPGIFAFGPDPSYVYLFDGLCIINGLVPGHVWHPGTPVQVLTGAVILVRWAISRVLGLENDGVASSVLKEPEAYLAFIAYVLLLLHSASNFYLGHKVAKTSGNVL